MVLYNASEDEQDRVIDTTQGIFTRIVWAVSPSSRCCHISTAHLRYSIAITITYSRSPSSGITIPIPIPISISITFSKARLWIISIAYPQCHFHPSSPVPSPSPFIPSPTPSPSLAIMDMCSTIPQPASCSIMVLQPVVWILYTSVVNLRRKQRHSRMSSVLPWTTMRSRMRGQHMLANPNRYSMQFSFPIDLTHHLVQFLLIPISITCVIDYTSVPVEHHFGRLLHETV